jgi:hypothetical protein
VAVDKQPPMVLVVAVDFLVSSPVHRPSQLHLLLPAAVVAVQTIARRALSQTALLVV